MVDLEEIDAASDSTDYTEEFLTPPPRYVADESDNLLLLESDVGNYGAAMARQTSSEH